ncbi:hypothetical protein [uncultured Fusobacterium sp.]|uniref:hypothetical protein n=1 Tax=uncultured Fusobacterium sp. TaxID=159267 RepID=UPI0015A58957|nr:hypothetical protein [uncultured Fusobacterium sp.]
MLKKKIYTIQPLEVTIENIKLLQDEKIKVLEISLNTVKFLRCKTKEILEVPTRALEMVVD